MGGKKKKMTEIENLVKSIQNTSLPHIEKCAIAYSGGLDSTLGIELLKRIYKAKEIIPITVDIGQSEEEIALAKNRAKKLGIEPIIIDKKDEFADEWLTKAIKANSDYFGYMVSTSMTRQLIAKEVAGNNLGVMQFSRDLPVEVMISTECIMFLRCLPLSLRYLCLLGILI